jgi:hypothetical protein
MISVILGVIGMFWLASFLTYRPKYKYYKETYLVIKNKQYLMSSNDESFIIFTNITAPTRNLAPLGLSLDDTKTILYFKSDETIKLTNGYIHKDFIPFFDPYTQYWHWKIKKEMLLHTRSIAEIRQDKLKQLNIK